MSALAGVTVGDDPAVWSALGFAVDDGRISVGGIALALRPGAGTGILGVTALGEGPGLVDDLSFAWTPDPAPAGDPQPNGVVALDHVVVATPDLQRTVSALQHAGFELRRVREEAGQAFLLAGPCILEVTASDRVAAPCFWGLAFAADLDALAARAGDLVGAPRDAVQAGRRIATARRDAGSGVPIAFLSPRTE